MIDARLERYYNAGCDTFWGGEGIEDCPYGADTPARHAWVDGYMDSEKRFADTHYSEPEATGGGE